MSAVVIESELLIARRKLAEAEEGSSPRAFWWGYIRALEWMLGQESSQTPITPITTSSESGDSGGLT